MDEIKTINVPQYYIAYYRANTEILQDMSEEGYATKELCQAAIAEHKKQDVDIEQELLQKYEDELKNFVLDLDDSDQEPTNPLTYKVRYDMRAVFCILNESGYTPVTEHVIPGLDSLPETREAVQTVNLILNGTLDPRTFSSVQEWLDVCFHDPCSDELKMCAINQVLEGYGIESVRTSEWKNGFWCDVLCTYVNMGDNCLPTVIHHREHGFMVDCICNVILGDKNVI